MKQEIEEKYPLKISSLLKNTPSTYILSCKEGDFILKILDHNPEDIIYRISILHLSFINLPIKSKKGKLVEKYFDSYMTIFSLFEEDYSNLNDIKLDFYIRSIATLHSSSSYPIKVNDGFFDESIQYIDKCISLKKEEYNAKMSVFEREDYHSPFEWMFILNYQKLHKALLEAERNLSLLEENWKKSKNVHLSLTYNNFSYSHILAKSGKLISIEKMKLSSSIYDLVDFINNTFKEKVDIAYYLNEYLSIHPLEEYEKYWLLSIVYIPTFSFLEKEIDNISSLYNSLSLLDACDSIEDVILSLDER